MAKRLNKKSFDVREWAKSKKNGLKTLLCDKKILDAIHLVLEMKANGESDVSLVQLHKMLQEQFNYPYGLTAFYKYIKQSESELWEKISGQK